MSGTGVDSHFALGRECPAVPAVAVLDRILNR